jgi:beta-aspartyl-peptidase (threonine type)
MPRPSIAIHGGAGIQGDEQTLDAVNGVTAAAIRGRDVLLRGGNALEAVLAAVVVLEDDPHFNAGTGSALTSDGTVENDASVMWGKDLTAGGVAVLSGFENPILVAEAVRDATPHVLLAAEGARRFALSHGFVAVAPERLVTDKQRQKWLAWKAKPPAGSGTVGAVACDADGHVAAATSTGGTFFKMPGRVGDTPIIGAGTYAEDGAGACSCTGQGEAIVKTSLAKAAVDLLRAGRSPDEAAQAALAELTRRTGGDAGLILVPADGRLGARFNTQRMSRALWEAGMQEPQAAVERG